VTTGGREIESAWVSLRFTLERGEWVFTVLSRKSKETQGEECESVPSNVKRSEATRRKMDFSVTMPEEWLQRRRMQVAEASRKVRARKKREEEELREENTRLREERTSLLSKITDLEKAIGDLTERDLDLENELLRTQLEQHKGFLKGFLETVAELEPSEASSKGEVSSFLCIKHNDLNEALTVAIKLSRQNRDFAMTHGLRIIAECQTNRDGSWRRCEVPFMGGQMLEGSDYSIWYNRPNPDSLNIRLDFVVPKANAKSFRELVVTSWTSRDLFTSVFGDGSAMRSCRELAEFSVDTEDEILRAHHAREPYGSKFTDTVFLTASGKTVMSKSTLALAPDRGPLLMQTLAYQDPHQAKKRQKPADPVDWGACGTVDVYYGIRTVTGHGLPEEDQDNPNIERNMSTAVELVYTWDDEVESLNPDWNGPCVRVIELLTLPRGFKFPAIGEIDDFIDQDGIMGKNFFKAIYNYIAIGIATVDPSAATMVIKGDVPLSGTSATGGNGGDNSHAAGGDSSDDAKSKKSKSSSRGSASRSPS